MTDMLTTIGAWLTRHDLMLDLIAVWVLFVGCLVMVGVKLISWAVLRTQRDRTAVGRTLKREKLGEAVAWAAFASLYGLGLATYYRQDTYGAWSELALRTLLIVGITVTVWWGIRFVFALRAERWGHADTDIRQAARGIAQDATDVRQRARQVRQDARDSERGAP